MFAKSNFEKVKIIHEKIAINKGILKFMLDKDRKYISYLILPLLLEDDVFRYLIRELEELGFTVRLHTCKKIPSKN